MSPHSTEEKIDNPNENLAIPKWINEEYFETILEKDVPDYVRITKFTTVAATPPGENYTSIMVRVVIEVELKDGSTQQISYILKTILDPGNQGADFVSSMNLFPKEMGMYANYLPKFQELYERIGMNLQFGPKCVHIEDTPEKITLVMEDLKRERYENVDRLKGLDMNHMEAILNKLAELHAASAVYAELNGPYPTMYNASFFNEANREMFRAMYDPRVKLFQDVMRSSWGLEDVEKYIAMTPNFDEYFNESVYLNTADPDELNVLNHGDCWSNNFMFTHNADEQVEKTIFVDFQICKWGSPAQDLWYLFTNSAQLDIRVKEFDHFIQIYHKRLVECLKRLNYGKTIPSLKQMHMTMLKYGYWGAFTSNSVTPAILLPSDKDANMDNFMKPGPEGDAFRAKAFANPIYIKSMLQWYPFLYRKGLFNIKSKSI